jgi:hypothetical protein
MRITNLDTLSAMLDRLVTENIKKFFFEKDGLNDKIEHQVKVIDELKEKISELFHECYNNKEYNYMSEKRTWKDDDVVEDISELTYNDILVGESDRGVLKQVTSDSLNLEELKFQAKRMRKSNEGRAENKNNIDEKFKRIVEE